MRSAGAKLAAVFLVLLAGIAAGVAGFAMLVLGRDEELSLAAAACGLALVAWVILHPARLAAERSER
jgi:hypothetical protein